MHASIDQAASHWKSSGGQQQTVHYSRGKQVIFENSDEDVEFSCCIAHLLQVT